MEKANLTIANINTQLGEMPSTTNNIKRFLNYKNMYELNDLGGWHDWNHSGGEESMTKKNLVVQLTEKCHTLEIAVNIFSQELVP